MVKRLTMILAGLAVSSGVAMAQTQVKGTVISQQDGEPIVGASVLVVGTKTGTITDADGNFTLTVPAGSEKLQVSYLGMKTTTVTATRNMKIKLVSDDATLNEVVVTAMGINRQAKTLGYAAQTLNNSKLTEGHLDDVTNALAGRVSGVQVNGTSGDPGQATSVIIRGISSINGSNQPLYVVDGVPLSQTTMDDNTLLTAGASAQPGHATAIGGISNVNPNDIKSMTVLKGAAATALYGSRAANSVIVITTKSGEKGNGRNFSITYDGGVQFHTVNILPEMQNEFGQGWNGVQTFIENGSWGAGLDGSVQVSGPIWNYKTIAHKYSAVKNNVRDFFSTGVSTSHNVALSGVSSDNKMTYYLSYAYAYDNGILPGDYDKYNRNTLAYRGTYQVTDWLKLSSSMNLAKTNTDAVGQDQGISVIDGLYEFPRDLSLVDRKNLSSAFNTPEAWATPYGITNPYWVLANSYDHNDSKQVFGKVQADINPIRQLTLTYRFGFDYTDFDLKIGTPKIANTDELITDDRGYSPTGLNQDGSVYSLYERKYELNHDFLANFADKYLDDRLDVNINAGVNMNERKTNYLNGETDNLTFASGFWNLSNGATKKLLAEYQMKRRLVGLFGDATFGWDDMVYLGLTARNDWSSTLPKHNNSYFYSGTTLSWIFTKLLPKNNILDFGKLRLAYGRTGNDASPYYTSPSFSQGYSDAVYGSNVVQFPTNGTNSFRYSNVAENTSLKPEMTTEFEVGTNLSFLQNRINLDFSYYHRVTKDQIFSLPVDPAIGYYYKVVNFGKVRNQGVELMLNVTPIKTNDWTWNLGFNFSKNNNKVLSMPESLEGGKSVVERFETSQDAVYMYAEVGKPIGELYTYEIQHTADGKIIVDSNGQPVQGKDLKDTGKNVNYDWTGGVTTDLTWKSLTLSAALDIRKGGYMFSRTKNLMQFVGNGKITTYNERRPFVIPNSVVATTDANGNTVYVENTTPLYLNDGSYQSYFNDYGYGYGGEAFLIDRSYVKLRNITLTWSLPRTWVHALSLTDIKLSAFCNNVFTWTAKDNYYIDPEVSSYGNDLRGMFGELYSNPTTRTFGFNVSVKF